MEDSTISRNTHTPIRRAVSSPSALLARCGLAGAACILLTLGASAAFAQDKKSDAPPTPPPAPAGQPSDDKAEYLKRLKENADKLGLNTDQQPATVPGSAAEQHKGGKPSPAATLPAGGSPRKPNVPGGAQPVKSQPGGVPPPVKAGVPSFNQPMPVAVPGVGGVAGPGGAASSGTLSIPQGAGPDPSTLGPDDFLINLTGEVELVPFVTYVVRDQLGLQVIFLDSGLSAQKFYLSAPIVIKRKDVLSFVTMLLEQKMYTLVQDSSGIYMVQPKSDVPVSTLSTPLAWGTTRIIHTPNIKPTSLQNSLTALLTAGRAGQAGVQPIYMDDLGLIIMTETPRVLGLVQDFVDALVAERANLKFYPFELTNISAAAAKDRVLELLGQQAQRTGAPGGVPGAPVAGTAVGAAGSLTNLGDRLTVDPTSNRLLLRGRDDERKLLGDMLAVIDVPNVMDSRWYPVGYKTSLAVAAQGKAEQLGTVTEFDFGDSSTSGRSGGVGGLLGGASRAGGPGAGGSQSDLIGSGAGFILYPESGGFIFRGTEVQHARVKVLVETLKIISADEVTTYEFYKLRHGKSTDIAEIIQNLLSNTAGTGNRSGGLLGSDLGRGRGNTRAPQAARAANTTARPGGEGGAAGVGGIAEIDGANVFVLADEPNNQVLVKAPAKLQHQFRELIGKLDLRRPQVFIDCKIIVVSSNDTFRLAVEAQQIIGQFAFNTNFGLGSLGTATSGDFQSPKTVNTGLSGLTSALIRSKDVPFIVNAIASNIDTRIVASPQLLVDDNEEAMISSVDQEPTGTTITPVGGQTTTGFQDYQEAGPKLTVTPQISEGGYLRLEYDIELSSFQGSGANNLPPPKLKNNVKSKVMVPTDATVVVGGLTFEQNGGTVVKIPLLGDIPLIGNLFKDQSKSGRMSTLYIFITPKIMRDPTFADMRLLTRAPLAEIKLPAEYPAPELQTIPVIDTARFLEEKRMRDEAEKHKVSPDISPAVGAPVRREPHTSEPQNP